MTTEQWTTLDKTDVVLSYLVHRGHGDSRRLALLLYLCDFECHRWRAVPVTDLDWTYGEEGPIDTRLYRHTARLEAAGLLREEVRGWTVRYAPTSEEEPDLEAVLSPGERRIVTWIAGEEYGPLPTETLLERVLESPPVRAGSPRHPLDLSLVDRAGPREVEAQGVPGAAVLLDLDATVRGQEAADRGEVISDEEFERELQARLRR